MSINNVSLLSQSTAQANRLKRLQDQLDVLQRQVSTQKKYDNFSGYGSQTMGLQRAHGIKVQLESYLSNISTVSDRMEMMNKSMSKITEVCNQMVTAIHLNGQNGAEGMASLKQKAQQNLAFIQDLINQQYDGRYIFAGANTTSPPLVDSSGLNSNFLNQVNSWLAGGGTTALFSATDGFSIANLGLAPGLPTAGNVTVHIDNSTDIDYTIKANDPGFTEILRSMAFLANMDYPDPVGPPPDVATEAEFATVMDHISTTLSSGIQSMNTATQQLASKFDLIKSMKESHQTDLGIMLQHIDKIENVDANEAIVSMQIIQTQLTAAYQVTKIVKDLTLVNYI